MLNKTKILSLCLLFLLCNLYGQNSLDYSNKNIKIIFISPVRGEIDITYKFNDFEKGKLVEALNHKQKVHIFKQNKKLLDYGLFVITLINNKIERIEIDSMNYIYSLNENEEYICDAGYMLCNFLLNDELKLLENYE